VQADAYAGIVGEAARIEIPTLLGRVGLGRRLKDRDGAVEVVEDSHTE